MKKFNFIENIKKYREERKYAKMKYITAKNRFMENPTKENAEEMKKAYYEYEKFN